MPVILWCLWIAPNVLCAVALVVAFRRKPHSSRPLLLSFLGYCVLQAVLGVLIRSMSATDFYLWWYLWLPPNALCAVALVIAFRRKCLTTLPWFSIHLGYIVLQTVAEVAIQAEIAYEWFALIATLTGSTLILAMIYELANKLILSHSPLARVFQPLSRWSPALLLLLATVAAALFHPSFRSQIARAGLTLNLSANLVTIGFLLTLLLVTRIAGVSWRSLPAGIALGLGISATGDLAGSALYGQRQTVMVGNAIRFCSWHMCVLVWLFYLLVPEKSVDVGESAMQMSKLERHPQELQRFFQR